MSENDDQEEMIDYGGPKVFALVPPKGLRLRKLWAEDKVTQFLAVPHSLGTIPTRERLVEALMVADELPEDLSTLL
jgi:hypothetical protein